MSCCHYDDGYEDAVQKAYEAIPDAIEAIARRFELCGNTDRAELLRDMADDIASWDLEHMIKKERERFATIQKLYAESRVA